MRLSKEQRKGVMQKYGVNRLWSFSRVQCFIDNCPWEYKARYIDHLDLNDENVYTIWGTVAHNLIENLMTKKIKYADMVDRFEQAMFTWETDVTKPRFDSEKIKIGYFGNLDEYFKHTQVPAGRDFKVEKPVLIRLGDKKQYVFVGYIDTEYVDEQGNTVLVDYKTSSKSSFSKAKLPKKATQLMLYAIGKHQFSHIPYDKIKCRFDMMKYTTVHYQQENGKWADSVQERSKWVSKMAKKLLTKLKKHDIDEDEANEMVQIASLNNDLSNMPQDIQDQFQLNNYYIEIPITQEACEKVAEKVAEDCQQILDFEALDNDDQISWLEVNHPYNPDDYFETHLCSYHTSDIFKQQEGSLMQDNTDDFAEMFADDDDAVVGDMFS